MLLDFCERIRHKNHQTIIRSRKTKYWDVDTNYGRRKWEGEAPVIFLKSREK